MPNLFWGIIVVLLSVAGYLWAWYLAQSGRYGASILCIMACGLLLRVYTGADLSLHDWDERYHALVSKNLLRHWLVPTLYDRPLLPYDYRNWTSNHIWLHKQPLTFWLIALSIKLFGLNAFAVRIPAILISTIAIKLVFDIARNWYNSKVAIISAFLFSIHGFIIELAAGRAGTDAVDVILLFFIVLSVWLAIRATTHMRFSDHLLLGGAMGLGMITKWLPALLPIPIWLVLSYTAFRGAKMKMTFCFLYIVIAIVCVVLPWQLYVQHRFSAEAYWELTYNSRHFLEALEGHDENFFYYFDHLRMKYGELVYLPILWFSWQSVKSRRTADFALLLWFWLPYLFFSIAATKMEAYTLIAAPAVFIITAIAIARLKEAIATNTGRIRYILTAILLGLIALPVRYSIERIKPFTVMDRNTDWNRKIEALQRSKLNSNKTIIFNCSHPIETMFFTDCITYEQEIDLGTRAQLNARGYTVIAANW
jgi:4-amino-4-deoxy-L-arabinose transferase